MSNENLESKIELLQDQIENLERSGFFTEAEIDRAVLSLKIEMKIYEQHLATHEFSESLKNTSVRFTAFGKALYGMNSSDIMKGMQYHLDSIEEATQKRIPNIEVVDAKILSQKES